MLSEWVDIRAGLRRKYFTAKLFLRILSGHDHVLWLLVNYAMCHAWMEINEVKLYSCNWRNLSHYWIMIFKRNILPPTPHIIISLQSLFCCSIFIKLSYLQQRAFVLFANNFSFVVLVSLFSFLFSFQFLSPYFFF